AAAPPKDTLTLRPVDWDALPGWADDHHAEALPALAASCAKLDGRDPGDRMGVDGYSGKVRDWRRLCAAAAKVPPGDDAAARAMFERELRPYEARGEAGPEGKMTGYCVQPLRGSRTRHGAYQIPLYRRPADLVSIDLTSFIKDARGRRIWGRVQRNGAVVPYPTRAEIRRGALDGEHLELVWVDDAIDALFVQIEGSGKVTLDDGSTLWLEFSGKNGRAYRGVGKVLRDLGELKKGQGTMPGIRAWFEAHPDRIDEILDKNTSMVFFAESSRPGAVGSQGVILTARRSLAVDRAFVAATTPIWVDTRAPHPGKSGEPPWRGLLIAQDTGGGILGPVRGDVYWGDDEDAADVAGRMGGPGRWWLLLPRALSPPTGPIPPGGH
ncbi:MAG: murein transglycosylase A, partial [Myxococcales bacterium]|nr:murein transglycosylase A [Myxococcales bacterium]